jgi:hypothetical protein
MSRGPDAYAETMQKKTKRTGARGEKHFFFIIGTTRGEMGFAGKQLRVTAILEWKQA